MHFQHGPASGKFASSSSVLHGCKVVSRPTGGQVGPANCIDLGLTVPKKQITAGDRGCGKIDKEKGSRGWRSFLSHGTPTLIK